MDTVLFLDRAPLTHLYAKMTPYMEGINCIHVAYSTKDVEILGTYGIKPNYVYLELFRQEYDKAISDTTELENIDNDIIENTKGRFNLNSAIQSDRGFGLLSYEECLKSAVAHVNVWKAIFDKHIVDLMLHEPCSLFFNFIGCVLCKKQGGAFTYQIACSSDKYDYSYLNAINDEYVFPELEDNFRRYLSNCNQIDRDRCNNFLTAFRNEQKTFMGDLLNKKAPFFKFVLSAVKLKFANRVKIKNLNRIYENLDYWLLSKNYFWEKVKNLIGYKCMNISFENELPKNEKYFFYPFHLEPEAVVLYLADGIYKNQIKLIENIAASLPAGYYLYVKDHPHEYAYREPNDYKRLMQVPNIRLLNQSISAKKIINNAQGVITINGTAGFEAALLNKQVYCFGHNMYSFLSRVFYIHNIRELKSTILKNINKNYEDDDELMAYVMAYLNSSHPGYINCYTGGRFVDNLDYEENAKRIAVDTIAFAESLSIDTENN